MLNSSKINFMKKTNIFTLTILASAFMVSCGDSKKSEEDEMEKTTTEVAKDTTAITVNDETKFKFDFAIANIPSPVGMMNEVSKWGEPYDNKLFNDTKKSNSYSSEFSKSINLGIYNIDLSYAMVNNKGEDVLSYMKTVMTLSESLGLKGAVDQMVGKRSENNLNNKDSLLAILDDIFVRSDSYLRTNERVFTATSVFAGSWIESLYLTSKITESTLNKEVKSKSYTHLWEQRFHLGNLIKVLEDFKGNKDAVQLNDLLSFIHEEISAIRDPKEMDDVKFKSISAKIYALRSYYTGK